MRGLINKFVVYTATVVLWLWAVVPKALDWVGRSTLPDDWRQLMDDRLPAWAGWLFSTPSWAPVVLAAIATGWLMYITRPHPIPAAPLPTPTVPPPLPSHPSRRQLTKIQKEEITIFLRERIDVSDKLLITYASGREEAADYAMDIYESVRLSGWPVRIDTRFLPDPPEIFGVQLIVQDIYEKPAAAAVIFDAMRIGEVPINWWQQTINNDDKIIIHVGRNNIS